MPDETKPLSKAEFATKLLRGEFDGASWFKKALLSLDEPIPALQDKLAVMSTNLDTYREPKPGGYGLADIPAGIEAIPDVVRNLVQQPKATLKGAAAGVLEGVGNEVTPAALLGGAVGKLSKEGRPLEKAAEFLGTKLEKLSKVRK